MNSVESCEQKDTSKNCNLLHCPSNLVKKKNGICQTRVKNPLAGISLSIFFFVLLFFFFFYIVVVSFIIYLEKNSFQAAHNVFFARIFHFFPHFFSALLSYLVEHGPSYWWNLVTTLPRISTEKDWKSVSFGYCKLQLQLAEIKWKMDKTR